MRLPGQGLNPSRRCDLRSRILNRLSHRGNSVFGSFFEGDTAFHLAEGFEVCIHRRDRNALLVKFVEIFFFLSFVFLGPHLRHMEVPRLGVESEL